MKSVRNRSVKIRFLLILIITKLSFIITILLQKVNNYGLDLLNLFGNIFAAILVKFLLLLFLYIFFVLVSFLLIKNIASTQI